MAKIKPFFWWENLDLEKQKPTGICLITLPIAQEALLQSMKRSCTRNEFCNPSGLLLLKRKFCVSTLLIISKLKQFLQNLPQSLQSHPNATRLAHYLSVNLDTNYHNRRQLVGANISTMLLEINRVTKQLPNERNFHVFYQLCLGKGIDKSELGLKSPDSFHYLNQGITSHNALNDGESFSELKKSLSGLGFSPQDQSSIWTILSSILQIGQINFTNGSQVSNQNQVSLVSKVLGVPNFANVFSNSAYPTRSRDAVAELLYALLFDWIIEKVFLLMTSIFCLWNS